MDKNQNDTKLTESDKNTFKILTDHSMMSYKRGANDFCDIAIKSLSKIKESEVDHSQIDKMVDLIEMIRTIFIDKVK